MESGISSSLNILFNKMENFVTSKTVIGEPITIGDVIILPLVDVSFGVGAGGAVIEKDKEPKDKSGTDGNAGALGAKITPSAVVVISKGEVSTINLKNQDSVSKLIDMVPSVVNKLNFGPFKKSQKEDEQKDVKVKGLDVVLDGEELNKAVKAVELEKNKNFEDEI